VLRSDKATGAQKKEAVKVLGKAVVGEVAKKVGESTYREAKKQLRKPETRAALAKAGVSVAKAAKVVGAVAATTAIPIAISGGLIVAGAKGVISTRQKQARAWADEQLALTRKRLGKQSLTKDQSDALWNQYYQHALKQPVQNPFTGK
jgi:hypothetical protein